MRYKYITQIPSGEFICEQMDLPDDVNADDITKIAFNTTLSLNKSPLLMTKCSMCLNVYQQCLSQPVRIIDEDEDHTFIFRSKLLSSSSSCPHCQFNQTIIQSLIQARKLQQGIYKRQKLNMQCIEDVDRLH